MILPMARQGGANVRTGLHLQEQFGDRSLRSSPLEQNVKEPGDNFLQSRRHPVLPWQPGAEEGSPSSTESIAVGDLVFPSTDVSTFQKLRGGATYVTDVATFSEDEDALDSTQDSSQMPLGRWGKQAGYSAKHPNLSTNINDVTPDELSTHSEDCSFHRVKLLCSYGGKIFPRPTDNQLRYVGGDTRLITVSRDIHFHELMQKMAELYAHAHTIKYKLPEEDLDALVSVSSNEDVANMMEEYDRLQSSDASPRLRLFLFSDMDHEFLPSNELLVDQRSTEQRYVDAVNGIPETGFRKLSGDGASLAVAPVVIDSLIDVVDSWGFIRQQDVVPMAMLAPQISQNMASLNHHVPVALPVSSISPVSAPSSAPSSPPLIPRVQKQGLTPEIRLMLHSDQHPNVSSHSIVQVDGGAVGAVDGDIDGVSLLNLRIVPERTHTSSDLQRGLESPRKLQHAPDALCTRQELVVRDDIRRTSEVRMPQISSHVKLTRLSDHHLEATAGTMHRDSHQQPQQSQQHSCWQSHLLEEQSQSYSRLAELGQPASDVVGQPVQQLQHLQSRSPFQSVSTAPTIDPAIYPSTDHQSQWEEVCAPLMQRSISTNAMVPFYFTAESSHYVGAGSAPSSPRKKYTGQPYSQLQQALRFAEQPHGSRQHLNIDSSNRAGPTTSPPRYRDYLGQTEDRLSRPVQQPVLASSDTLQPELFLYDAQYSAHGQCSDGVARMQVPYCLGLNPFHDNPSSFSDSSSSETQDGDGRRQRKRTSQQALHTPHVIAREDMQDHNSLSNESLSAHSGCQEFSMDRVILHRGRDVDETRFRHLEKGCTGQSEQVNEHVDEGIGADLEAIGGSFSHVLGGSEHLLALSDSHQPKDTDMVASVSGSYQHSRSSTSEVLMMPGVLSTLRQASVLDITQVPLVGRECEPGFFAETAPRTVEGMPEFDSSPALFKVCQLSPEVYMNELVSQTEDNKAAIGSCNNLSVSSITAVNNDPAKTAEVRWTERHDDNESGLVLQTRDTSDTLDHYQQVSGLVIPQGRLSESLTRIEASEVALHLLQRTSSITQGDAAFAEDVENTTASGPRSLMLHDVNSPFKTQFPLSIGQKQVMQPVTTRVTSFTIPALSITVSTESSMPSMLSVSASTSTSVGTSITEHEANCMDSRPFKPEPTTPRNFQADVRGVLGQGVDFRRKDAKELMSQVSATGHLAEDVASSVLASPRAEMLAPLSSTINMQAENKGNWHFLSQEAPAVTPSNLIHAPTFSASNWNNVQNLTVIDDVQSCTPDSTAVIEDSRLQSPTIMKEDLTATEGLISEAAVIVHDNLIQAFSNPGSAEDAEAEAIRSGLQTILNADLEEMRELGSGTFGTVYHGKWRGTDVAIKRIKSSCFAGRPAERDRLIADFWREACTLSQLHHPNVVAFYGVVRDGPGGTLATVTEYMVNGSLKQVLQKKDRTIDRRKRLLIAMDAAFGMEYLHSKNIVHFDLKCDNLLVNMRDPHRPICKVGDLGLSKVKHQTMVSGGVRGTLPWMAPELLNGSSTLVTEKVDVFSFGIVMWELLTGEEPYASMHYGAIIGGIVNNTLRPTIPTWCDPLWKSLMERCWSAEPTFRPSFSEVASELRVMATAPQPKARVSDPVAAVGR